MTFATLSALYMVAITFAFTPGPNNSLLASSGATYGLRGTWPLILGATAGVPLMMFVVTFVLGDFFASYELLREALRWGGAAMLLWVAFKVATASPPSKNEEGRHFGFGRMVAFQWINAKTWVICLAVAGQFIGEGSALTDALTCAFVFATTAITSALLWTSFGIGIARLLRRPLWLRLFNGVMAAMIAAGVASLIAADLS